MNAKKHWCVYVGYKSMLSELFGGAEYRTIRHTTLLCNIICELSEQAWDFCPPPLPTPISPSSPFHCGVLPPWTNRFHWVLPLALYQVIKKKTKQTLNNPTSAFLPHYMGINYSSNLLLFRNFSTSRYLLPNLLCRFFSGYQLWFFCLFV